eukprot:scaffold17875_cov112-Isochrysis_galbana.AAC.5
MYSRRPSAQPHPPQPRIPEIIGHAPGGNVKGGGEREEMLVRQGIEECPVSGGDVMILRLRTLAHSFPGQVATEGVGGWGRA